MTELPEITDEDRAVAAEATRLYFSPDALANANIPTIVAALVRTGWKPVDPDLILAREVVVDANRAEADDGRYDDYIRGVEQGEHDSDLEVKIALAAIKAVRREQGR